MIFFYVYKFVKNYIQLFHHQYDAMINDEVAKCSCKYNFGMAFMKNTSFLLKILLYVLLNQIRQYHRYQFCLTPWINNFLCLNKYNTAAHHAFHTSFTKFISEYILIFLFLCFLKFHIGPYHNKLFEFLLEIVVKNLKKIHCAK